MGGSDSEDLKKYPPPSPAVLWFASVRERKTQIEKKNKVAHHQACNIIKKRLQHTCSTVNFAKLLKALCKTPSVSAFNFNSTFLTLRPRKTYIYVFQAILFLLFLSHFMLFIEARDKSIWSYTKCWVKQAIFDVLIY